MVNRGWLLDLVERTAAVANGATVTIDLGDGDPSIQADTVAAWCSRTGNTLVGVRDNIATVRRGPAHDAMAELPADQVPGTRLWMYTNFDCNLACDYCCVRSSPQSERRALGIDRIRQLASEAVQAGVSELLLTGGEPFLLPDIDEVVAVCTDVLPTTLLTNGMLFKGRRLEALRKMDRERLTLQISLDSATPEVHDSHRGRGSWARAVAGMRLAIAEGFRVKVAATLAPEHSDQRLPFHAFLDSLGIARQDQVIRALAHRGVAESGLELTLESLIPEVTITADGVYWHPVSADHEDQLVTADIFPLAEAIREVQRRFTEQRAYASAAGAMVPLLIAERLATPAWQDSGRVNRSGGITSAQGGFGEH